MISRRNHFLFVKSILFDRKACFIFRNVYFLFFRRSVSLSVSSRADGYFPIRVRASVIHESRLFIFSDAMSPFPSYPNNPWPDAPSKPRSSDPHGPFACCSSDLGRHTPSSRHRNDGRVLEERTSSGSQRSRIQAVQLVQRNWL